MFALSDFVDLPEWSAVAAAVQRRLCEHPGARVTLDCERLTGLTPDVFLAIGHLLRSAPGRVRLRNWPAALRDLGPKLVTAHVLDCLLLTVSRSARRLDPVAPGAELERSVGHLTASVDALKRAWFGPGERTEVGAPVPAPVEPSVGSLSRT
ncbi:hypothetical protein C1280_05705 [Gemmata obscuriglobus]|uniref:STAS domain-containing protein n=1 Tax=Gemmata obscuriglobus TaxID=114 RepID=A0A2Z3GQI7_9BACT|nr:hypothetical protein C1280_05705 [Gemmata obscuriglobus]